MNHVINRLVPFLDAFVDGADFLDPAEGLVEDADLVAGAVFGGGGGHDDVGEGGVEPVYRRKHHRALDVEKLHTVQTHSTTDKRGQIGRPLRL